MQFVYPMFAMFLLTIVATWTAFVARVQAVRQRAARIDDFKVLDVGRAPEFVARTTKHFANLFEMPVLFYAGCLVALSLRLQDATTLAAAWAYVGLRVVHTSIHLTNNRVRDRLAAFMLSNAALVVLWVRLVVAV